MVGSGAQGHLLPQIGGQVGVRLGDGSIGGLGEVAEGSSGATGRGVAILNTGHGQQLLGHGGRDDAGTTGGRDEAHGDGAALADDCLVERVRQHKCYIVATNDKDLKNRIRKIPGVPIMYVAAHKYAIERMPEAYGVKA